MRDIKVNVFLFFLFCIFVSCGNRGNGFRNSSQDSLNGQTLPVDTIVSKNKINSGLISRNGGYHYSVYLPDCYDKKKKLPVIIFFDPHAKADIPLEKYKNLSNRYGFILLSSSDSKNGLQPNLYAEIYKSLKEEILSKYAAQPDRIYCAGFSGGARVAINVGLSDKTVAGVIANSAGFEPSRSPITADFVFAGIAGNEDFNLLEQRRTEKFLQELPAAHLLIEFDGTHEWAPEAAMEYAFAFLESDARRKFKPLVVDTVSRSFIEREIKKGENIRDRWDRYQFLRRINFLLYEKTQLEKYTQEMLFLENTSEVRNKLKLREEKNAQESVLQSSYYNKVFTESISWWQNEVKSLNREAKDREEILMNKRIKSYLSLAVYLTITSPQARQEVILMEKLIEIYALVDEKNPEWAYQKALLRAKQGNIEEATTYIKKKFGSGFQG